MAKYELLDAELEGLLHLHSENGNPRIGDIYDSYIEVYKIVSKYKYDGYLAQFAIKDIARVIWDKLMPHQNGLALSFAPQAIITEILKIELNVFSHIESIGINNLELTDKKFDELEAEYLYPEEDV